MNWSHPLVLVAVSALIATVTTLLLDVLLKPMLQPQVEARVEDWKRRRHLIVLTEKWKTHWDDRDEYEGPVGPDEIKGSDLLLEELNEFRFQRHHRSEREAVAARFLIWALSEEGWFEAIEQMGLMEVRDEILDHGCAYLTAPRRRRAQRNLAFQELEDCRRFLHEQTVKENIDIPLP